MKNVKRAAAGLTVMAATVLTAATPAQAANWDCPQYVSCYWSDAGGSGSRWIAPSAGCHDLGRTNPRFNDRISSVYNRGNGAVDMYNYISLSQGWELLATVPRGGSLSFAASDSRNDKIDMVCIAV